MDPTLCHKLVTITLVQLEDLPRLGWCRCPAHRWRTLHVTAPLKNGRSHGLWWGETYKIRNIRNKKWQLDFVSSLHFGFKCSADLDVHHHAWQGKHAKYSTKRHAKRTMKGIVFFKQTLEAKAGFKSTKFMVPDISLDRLKTPGCNDGLTARNNELRVNWAKSLQTRPCSPAKPY